MSTTERVTVSCSHSHTVTLRLDEGEWPHPPRWAHTPPWTHVRMSSGYEIDNASDDGGKTWVMSNAEEPPAIRAELEAALAAAEASCGGCGCADRLRAEAERLDAATQARYGMRSGMGGQYRMAADFLDAAPDARGSNLSDEQPASVSEQGHAKKRAEWNDPNGGRTIPDGFVEAFQKVSDETRNFLDQEATDG